MCWDADYEMNGSKCPPTAAVILKSLGDLLIMYVQEEVAEMISSLPETFTVIVDGGDMSLAQGIVDLVKSDVALMEKAGARNNKSDAAMIQTMHDNAVKLGADCEAALAKAAALELENEVLTKAVDDTVRNARCRPHL
jgi:hypothetical protein